jgi:hypothetical protein
MKKLLTTTLIILILFVAVPFSHAVYAVLQLTDDTYDDFKPQINNTSEVVYEKHLPDDSEIYKNIDQGLGTDPRFKEYDISWFSGGFDYNPQINSNGDVLWESDVDGYHFINVQPSDWFPMAISPTDPNNPPQLLPLYYLEETYPQFNDKLQIVWRAIGDPADDIWLYDSTIHKLQIGCRNTKYTFGSNLLIDKHPQINADGFVVWQAQVYENYESGQENISYDIYLFDGDFEKGPINISNSIDVDDEYPQINDHGIVVWEGAGHIYRYTGGNPEKISNSSEYINTAPQIINQCGLVVWQGCNSFDCEIFLYNGISAVNISNDPGHHDEDPQINERGQVVWVKDYLCGDDELCSYEQSLKRREIMLYDHYEKTLANISNRYGDDEEPQINDIGEVVWSGEVGWSGYHIGTSEIFKATPVSMTAVEDAPQLGPDDKYVGVNELCEYVSNMSSSLEEAHMEEVKFEKETLQEPTNVTKRTSAAPLRISTESLSLR